ncbi:hypothetical protein D3C77_682820 [compost metagenome]
MAITAAEYQGVFDLLQLVIDAVVKHGILSAQGNELLIIMPKGMARILRSRHIDLAIVFIDRHPRLVGTKTGKGGCRPLHGRA